MHWHWKHKKHGPSDSFWLVTFLFWPKSEGKSGSLQAWEASTATATGRHLCTNPPFSLDISFLTLSLYSYLSHLLPELRSHASALLVLGKSAVAGFCVVQPRQVICLFPHLWYFVWVLLFYLFVVDGSESFPCGLCSFCQNLSFGDGSSRFLGLFWCDFRVLIGSLAFADRSWVPCEFHICMCVCLLSLYSSCVIWGGNEIASAS